MPTPLRLPRAAAGRTVALLTGLLAGAHALAVDVAGTVRGPDGPLGGAMVTATDAHGIATTVYAAADGRFRIAQLESVPVDVRGRAPGLDDAHVASPSGDVALVLAASKAPLAHAPSSTFLSLLPDGVEKRRFIMNCGTCHELQSSRIWKEGKVRDHDRWVEAINLMRSIDVYALVPPYLETEHYATWLATNLSPERVAALQPPARPDPAIVGGAKITEYPVLNASELPHDLVLGPDGRIWVTAFWQSQMWAMDPKTGKWESYEVTNDKSQPAQVRALEFDRAGKLWIVLGGTKSVVRLDPKTREFKTYPVDMYAHDLVIDSKGDVWVNDYFSKPERIAKLDTKTGRVTNFPLPSANLSDYEGKPLPYGLQIDAQDRLWSTQLSGNTLVRFDTRTGQSKLYRMPEPNSGPRRQAIGRDGSVWIPEFNTGYLTRFDPKTETFERHSLGDPALGAYDVAVDPKTGVVWITGSLGTALVRFDPKTAKVERYPLPTEPAYMRHVQVDPRTGDVWSAYSSLPTVEPKVVRLVRGRR
jgi:virginiamycin B lyase